MTMGGGKFSQLVDATIERQESWLEPIAERLQGALHEAGEQGGPTARRVKDFLNGTWLGHPLHPVLTDAAIGAWFTGAMLDLVGEDSGADAAFTLGVACAVPTAASGMADWSDQFNQPRRVGLIHAFVNGGALALFLGSLLARRSGDRPLGIGLSTAGLTLATVGAYLGGELVYSLGTGVSRTAWAPRPPGWKVAARVDDLVEGRPTKGQIEVDGQKVAIVLLKKGNQVYALNDTCAHLGGPLSEGKLVDEVCIECPWHGSRFDMRDGSVTQGPSAFPQQSFDVRLRAGNVDVRLRK